MFELMEEPAEGAKIMVIGVGGGGGNAVCHMLASEVKGVDFICANTDAQDLEKMSAGKALQIGSTVTRKLGAGANPELGRQAAMEDRDHIEEAIRGSDMLFITAGMGGGTGTGAAPVVAQVARELGILTVAVVTRPFSFEGDRRARVANEGVQELAKHVDSLIIIPNDKLQEALGKDITFLDAFKAADEVLQDAVMGITDLIFTRGVVNLDFADVRTIMSNRGNAMMGIGSATGEDRARKAAEKAIHSPLLDDTKLAGAKGILVNVTAGRNLSMTEHQEAAELVKTIADPEANIIVGTVIDESMEDELRVTVVATGFPFDGDMETAAQPVQAAPVPLEPAQAKLEAVADTVPVPVAAVIQPHTIEIDPNIKPNYAELDKPTVIRTQDEGLNSTANNLSQNIDFLDIPAFLRRQAD